MDILVCTDNGDMIVCDNSGEFKAVCLDTYRGHPIECVTSLDDGGFLIAFENSFLVYRTSTNDPRAPLKRIGEKTTIQMATNEANFNGSSILIRSMALNSTEDTVYVVTNQG